MQRVAVVELSGRVVALPYPADGLVRAHTLERDGDTVAIFFDPLARSPLEGRDIPSSRAVGSITAFRPQASDGGVLRFDDAGQLNPVFRAESGETFDVFGRSAEGRQLERVPVTSAFWFSVAAAYPAIEIMELEASVDDREIDP